MRKFIGWPTTGRKKYVVRGSVMVGALALAATTMSACGSSDGSSGQDGSKGLGSVKIAKAVDNLSTSSVDIADKKGYFKDAGLGVQTILSSGSSNANAALQGGSVQFTVTSSTSVLLARSQGVPLVAVAGIDYGVPLQVIASEKWINERTIDLNAPLNERLKALEGAKIAQEGATDLLVGKLLMTNAGLDPDAAKFVKVGGESESVNALVHNTVDISDVSPPASYVALERAKGSKMIASARDIPEASDATYNVLVTTPEYAKKNPEIVKAVATAIARVDNDFTNDPDSLAAMLHEHFDAYDESAITKSLEYFQYSEDGLQEQKRWDDALKFAILSGAVPKDTAATEGEVWTNEYIDKDALSSSK